MKGPAKYYIWCIVLALFILLMAIEGWYVLVAVYQHIGHYKWIGLGLAVFWVIHRLVHKNMSWLKVFSHELTHAVVSLLLFRRVHSLQAEEREGVVYTSGNDKSLVLVALAPYCLPIYTYLFLIVWSLVSSKALIRSDGLWALDILIGITLAFHGVCFKEQTKRYQPDINQYPLAFSYLYIIAFQLFNLLVVLLSHLQYHDTRQPLDVWGAMWYLIRECWNRMVDGVMYLF